MPRLKVCVGLVTCLNAVKLSLFFDVGPAAWAGIDCECTQVESRYGSRKNTGLVGDYAD